MILTWWFVQYQGVGTLYEGSSFSEQAQAVDKAFHLLDGKGLPKYPGDFLTAVREAMRRSRGPGFAGESEYFRFRVYGNGNVHLELERMDLVAERTASAAGTSCLKRLRRDQGRTARSIETVTKWRNQVS
jgi:hypothetical protein